MTLVGLSIILGRWLGMVVSSINNATPGCVHFALKLPYFKYRIIPMQTKLASSIIQFAKVSLGDMKKPSEPINKERGINE